MTENDVDGETLEAAVTQASLKKDLGIKSYGLRCKIWEAISTLKSTTVEYAGSKVFPIQVAPSAPDDSDFQQKTFVITKNESYTKKVSDERVFNVRNSFPGPDWQENFCFMTKEDIDNFHPPLPATIAIWSCPVPSQLRSARVPVHVFVNSGDKVIDFWDNSGSYFPKSLRTPVQDEEASPLDDDGEDGDDYISSADESNGDISITEGEESYLIDDTVGDMRDSVKSGPLERKRKPDSQPCAADISSSMVLHTNLDDKLSDMELVSDESDYIPEKVLQNYPDNPLDIDVLIGDIIEKQRQSWYSKILPKLQLKAHIIYTRRAQGVQKWTKNLSDIVDRRLPRLIREIKDASNGSLIALKKACENLRPSIESIEELRWKLELSRGEAPAKDVKSDGAKKRPPLKKTQKSEYESDDEHWSDFIASEDEGVIPLSDGLEPKLHIPMEYGECADTPIDREFPEVLSASSDVEILPLNNSSLSGVKRTVEGPGMGGTKKKRRTEGEGQNDFNEITPDFINTFLPAQTKFNCYTFDLRVDTFFKENCSDVESFRQRYSQAVSRASTPSLGRDGRLETFLREERQLFFEYSAYIAKTCPSESDQWDCARDFQRLDPLSTENIRNFITWRTEQIANIVSSPPPTVNGARTIFDSEGYERVQDKEDILLPPDYPLTNWTKIPHKPKPVVTLLDSDRSEGDEAVMQTERKGGKGGGRKGRRDIRDIVPESIAVRRLRDAREKQERDISRRARRQNQAKEGSKILVNLGHSETENPIYVDDFLGRHLKPHQIDGIRFMWKTILMLKHDDGESEEAKHAGSILAHAMGLDSESTNHSSRHFGGELDFGIQEMDSEGRERGSLWINLGLTSLLCTTYSEEDRLNLVNQWFEEGGVLILSYNIARALLTKRDVEVSVSNLEQESQPTESTKQVLLKAAWRSFIDPGPSIIICDEAHILKNPKALITNRLNETKTPSRVCLTGYPLQNNLEEYWCMVDFVVPGYLGTLDEFRNQYCNPIMNGSFHDSTDIDKKISRERLHVLIKIIEPVVLRLDTAPLKSSLPEKIELVVVSRLTPLQHRIYQEYLKVFEFSLKDKIFGKVMSFSVLCNHPAIFKTNLRNGLDKGATALKGLEALADEDLPKIDWNDPALSTKMVIIQEIVEKASAVDDKVLLFSRSLDSIGESFIVFRYGQQKKVYVYRLVTSGTIEEKLHKNNLKKVDLATRVVDRKESTLIFSKTEFKNYFEVPSSDPPSELNRELDYGDTVLRSIIDKVGDELVRVQSQEDFLLQELGAEMTEDEKASISAAYDSEIARRACRVERRAERKALDLPRQGSTLTLEQLTTPTSNSVITPEPIVAPLNMGTVPILDSASGLPKTVLMPLQDNTNQPSHPQQGNIPVFTKDTGSKPGDPTELEDDHDLFFMSEGFLDD
ncbi:hypothetical protein HDU67_007841 [Dinochytrium kinnereticum]|nr:hypothetical protein HDU67_007841 [Dinochytrium kinnereticum]